MEKRRILNFSQELQKDKSFQMLSPAIHLEGWGRYFEHEHIIETSKNLIESWNTNEWFQFSVKDLSPYQLNLMLNSYQGVASFRQTQTLIKQKFGQT